MRQFRFIDGTKTDRPTRRTALSHAMKGKNVGKKHNRHRRSNVHHRLATGLVVVPKPFNVGEDERSGKEQEEEEVSAQSSAVVCNSLALPWMMETTTSSKGSLDVIKNYFTSVVEVVYPPVLCLSLEHVKAYWIQLMFVDRTSYHCSLALMSTLNGFVFTAAGEGQGEEVNEPPEAIHHLGQAIRLVNQKLGTEDALSASCISVVNFLIVREMIRGDRESAEIHLTGLRKMVTLRGGLERLEGEDRTLVLKICKTDIDYALHYGTPTTFYRDRMFDYIVFMTMNKLDIGHPTQFPKIDPFLQEILLDANTLTYWVDNASRSFRTDDPHILQEVIVSLGYRLIQFRALRDELPVENKIEATIHIGLIAFLTTLFLQAGGRRFLRYDLVVSCLRDIVEGSSPGKEELESIEEYKLWVLLIGGISVMQEAAADRSWSVLQIQHLIKSMGLESWTWPQLRRMLGWFPWIGRIHDQPGRVLWEEVTLGLA